MWVFIVTLASILGLTLSIWHGRSVSASQDPESPQFPDPSIFERLEHAQVPEADLAELAARLGGRNLINTALPALSHSTYDLGDHQSFWVSDMHGSRFQVETKLQLATAHGRMWVQDDLEMEHEQLTELGSVFEEKIYPDVVSLLGAETFWRGLPIEFVFTDRLGARVAGYFSPRDLVHPEISETSNGRRMILINIERAPDHDQLARLVAHELQHLLHWALDSNEKAWVQEGFSEFAEQLLGDDHSLGRLAYLSDPDLQLNAWPLERDFARNYGASSLLITYLHDRFGPGFVRALALHPEDGLRALDALLLEAELWDSSRNRVLTTEDVMLDWGLANLLQLDTGPYAYTDGRDLPQPPATEFVGRCTETITEHTVSQYGFDFIRIQCDKAVILEFTGGHSTRLLPTVAHSGEYFFWSNRGDQIDTRLSRQFDFTEIAGPLTLQFWTWYELEKGSDFVYLVASEDGQHWSFLETTSGNPAGDAAGMQLGFGFSGINRRHEWSQQTVDLSQFAGKRVMLRFEYVTDTARTGEGFLIDDISIAEANYQSDFEDGPAGWHGEGFVRISNKVPQDFRVATVRADDPANIEYLALDASNRMRVSLNPGEEIVLLVMGATRHTQQPAPYTLSLKH